jgi:predicted DNA-binding transcriptional regulator YafY
MGFSKRTLQRDIREIRNLHGVDIEYSAREKGYFINQSEAENLNFERRMEAFDLFNALSLAEDLAPYIHLENRRPQGTENLYGLLHAIKNGYQIRFSYQKFWEGKASQRTVEPYGLKEFKNRWYVIARDLKDGNVKTFALDRLTELEITNQKFETQNQYNMEQSFRDCFGIISPTDEKPQDIVLIFDAFQGKYIKTLPLHHSQQILVDNAEELKIRLRLCVTHDFVMELLSYGDGMVVLEPKSLANEIRDAHSRAFNQYE